MAADFESIEDELDRIRKINLKPIEDELDRIRKINLKPIDEALVELRKRYDFMRADILYEIKKELIRISGRLAPGKTTTAEDAKILAAEASRLNSHFSTVVRVLDLAAHDPNFQEWADCKEDIRLLVERVKREIASKQPQ